MYKVDYPKPEELTVGRDVIVIPGEVGYDYETRSWPAPEEAESFLARVEDVRPTSTGHALHCRYLDDGDFHLHAVLSGGTVQRVFKER